MNPDIPASGAKVAPSLPPDGAADFCRRWWMEVRYVTDAWLRAVKPPATGRLEVRDSGVRGLIVRVTSSGAISYSARKAVNGRHSRVTVGTWPMGIAEARRLAMG